MSDMIGLSERTIHRRLSSNNLYIRSNYSDISDEELDEMAGHLTSRSFRIHELESQ